jgi:YVTN family beta-propeller protein
MKKLALALMLACLLAPASSRAQNAYITNESSSTISVIDTTMDAVIATIPVGPLPVGVAATPDGSKVYITLLSSNTVQVINTATNAVSATIPVGDPTTTPRGLAVTPDGSKVYVVSPAPFNPFNPNPGSNIVSVIDTATNTVITTIPVGDQHTLQPTGVAVPPDGTKVYLVVDDNFSGSVSVIDTATNTVSATLPFALSSLPGEVTVSPNAVVVTITVGRVPIGVAVTPDGSKVYVTDGGSNTVQVINTATNAVSATILVGSNPVGISIQQAPRFAGIPGSNNCHGTSVSALATKFGGLDAAAAALRFSTVQGLQDAIRAFCEG